MQKTNVEIQNLAIVSKARVPKRFLVCSSGQENLHNHAYSTTMLRKGKGDMQ